MKTLRFPVISYIDEQMDGDDEQPPQESAVDFVPDCIMEQILVQLPAKTVFRFMAVSKSWLSMIDCRRFAVEHLSRSVACPLLVFNDPMCIKGTRILHLDEGRTVSDFEPGPTANRITTRIEFPDFVRGRCTFLHGQNTLATSCKGLVCWATRGGAGDIIVCNPITGEYAFMNNHGRGKNNQREVAASFLGLGFSRTTNTFELLKMTLGTLEDDPLSLAWWPELCRVGGKSWRKACDVAQVDFGRRVYDIVYVSGAMYWRYEDGEDEICTFDFDRNAFRIMLLPDSDGSVLKPVSLGVLNDFLCVSFVNPNDGHVELWVPSHNDIGLQVNWNRVYSIETLTTRLEHSGGVWARGEYQAIRFMGDGKILMHDWETTFLVYDTVTGAEKLVRLVEDLNDVEETTNNRLLWQVVPHVPNIMSMKDILNLREGHVRIMKVESR